MNTKTTSTQTQQPATVSNATQTTVRSYAQAAAQTEGHSRSYTEVAVQTTKPIPARTRSAVQEKSKPTQEREISRTATRSAPAPTRALVVHGVKLVEKLGKVREETEKSVGRVLGIRWLLKAERRQLQGKTSSSVVIYLERPSQAHHVWLGKRRLRAERYDFDRGRDVEMM